MDEHRFEQEKYCGAMLAIAGRLYRSGLATEQEYDRIRTEVLGKYRPAGPIPGKSITGGKEDFNS